jgi:hypothetical protein
MLLKILFADNIFSVVKGQTLLLAPFSDDRAIPLCGHRMAPDSGKVHELSQRVVAVTFPQVRVLTRQSAPKLACGSPKRWSFCDSSDPFNSGSSVPFILGAFHASRPTKRVTKQNP